ncbi:T-lymphocyte activation antigen CD80 isoform X2 [Dermochelys coriacea]|uniref:T-lymphocyte activation antigen CD80 isoform X2 n=1 Tax=Dermochelys coriacea TaxID=27794 RepID=UPI001CA9D5C8|nr:T-lymphocyte activation antigen CD80 isoform X2 [Dermochelys coriacea]
MVCAIGAELMWSGLALKNWFWQGLFVLHFTSLVFAQEKMHKAKVGDSILLPCCHELPNSNYLINYRVYWQTKSSDVVMAYSEGKLVMTNAMYMNRTKMDPKTLTMSIFPVKLSDDNKYECIVQELENGAYKRACDVTVVLVVVADFSKPVISADVPKDACGSTEVMVNCSSHGGFPEPRVSGILNNMSVDWQTKPPGSENSLYNVTAKLQLNLTEDIFLTCTIEYDDFKVSSNYSLKKLKECSPSPRLLPQGVIIASSLVLICIFLVAIALLLKYFWCHGCEQLRCSHSPVPQDPGVGTEIKGVVRDDIPSPEATLEEVTF